MAGATAPRWPCLVGMLALSDLWGALMVPMLFGDAGAVDVKGAMPMADQLDGPGSCDLWDIHQLLVEVASDGVYIEDSHVDVTIWVDREIDGEIDEEHLAMVLRSYRRSPYFVDRHGLLLATAIDVANAVGFSDIAVTTASELELWKQLDDGATSQPAPSRDVLEECWRFSICSGR
jgi:hypothetical protein